MHCRKRVFIFSLFVILVSFSSTAFAIEAGTPAPDFKLQSITGEEVRLSDFEGQLVLLKLATTWCPTCQQLSGAPRHLQVQARDQASKSTWKKSPTR